MAITPLTAQLPATAGALPDLFRRADSAALVRTADAPTTGTASSTAADDTARETITRTDDDITRMLARRAALGPLTYGRSSMAAAAPAAAPIGMRGAHLDVRG